jgi:4-hydroxy-tetrahydrodipicolinate synthase
MDEVKGQVPVVAGVIDMTPLRVNEHVKRAKTAGVEGIVVTAPFFTRTHPAEIEKHFRLIKEACGDLHLYAYDIPVAVNGVKLDAEMMLRLGAEGVISGVKDSSGNDAGIRSLVIGKRELKLKNFVVMTGSELTVDSALAFGADGVVPGIGNVDPAGYVSIFDAVKRGDFAAAQSEQDRLIQMFDLIFVGAHRMSVASSALGAFKASLKLLGIIDDALMAPPYLPLNEDEIEKIKPFLIKAGLLK